MMKTTKNKKDAAIVFSVEGRLDSNTSPDLEKEILDAISEGNKDVILNFALLDYISSAGIRVLIHCHKELEKLHGHIFLTGVPKPIENIFYLTGFLPYFKMYEEDASALAALQKLKT